MATMPHTKLSQAYILLKILRNIRVCTAENIKVINQKNKLMDKREEKKTLS
jgi:hypothetical protein